MADVSLDLVISDPLLRMRLREDSDESCRRVVSPRP